MGTEGDKQGARANPKSRRLTDFLVPSFAATVLTLAVTLTTNLIIEHNKTMESEKTHNETFIKLLTDEVLNKRHPTATLDEENAATVALFALDGLAESESEHAAVLLVAGRLVNSNSKRSDSGGPAARFLDVAIGEIKERAELRGREQEMDERLMQLVRSRGFVDLVSSGYATVYYEDNVDQNFQPTLMGDSDTGVGAKEQLLSLIGPDTHEGWIHIASWTLKGSRRKIGEGLITDAPAAVRHAIVGGKVVLGELRDQYAVDPIVAADWISATSSSTSVRLLAPRLLRDSPPLSFISPTGTIMIGTLGRVIGVVPGGSCIIRTDPARAILVYVESRRIDNRALPGTVDGIIHLWAHVKDSPSCAT